MSDQRPAPADDFEGQNLVAFLGGLLIGQLGRVREEGHLKIVEIEDRHEAVDGTKIDVPVVLASGRRLLVSTELIGWVDATA